jgi:hypothetical protein
MLETLAPAESSAALSQPAAAPAAAPPGRGRLATRVAFRFSFLYFGLYVLTTQMLGGMWVLQSVQPPDMGATGWMLRPVVWTADHVFHAGSDYVRQNTGSGDKMIDWVHVFLLLVFSAAATLVWSAVDRRRAHYASLHKWFHFFLRFAAGTTMVGYGMAKAIPLQMPAPQLTRLLERYGDFSPMGVLWYSVGASFPYERFAGAMELTAAVLLFIPRLSMLGAMVLVADSIQIFTLNMTYDVPVKLFSFHLILIGLVLLAPEMRRLFQVLVFNRGTHPSTLPPLARGVVMRRALVAAQLVFGAVVIWQNYSQAIEDWKTRGAGAPKPPLYGIWNVEKMTIDGVERAPLLTDYPRWRRIVIQNSFAIMFQHMDETFTGFPATIDATAKTITIKKTPQDKTPEGTFAFTELSPDALVLDGELSGHKMHLETKRFDHTRLLLLSRGFNWIQERPFNK